jgi:glycosyltransferase involved in cell wall biosynthesis
MELVNSLPDKRKSEEYMRIVMFTDAYWPRVNGVTVSVDSFSHALIAAGNEVLIVCSSYPDSLNETNSLFDIHEKKNVPKIVRVPSMTAFITKEDRLAKLNKWFWVFKQVENFNPDIIHINSEVVIAEFGFWYAKIHKLPAIYTFHTMWEEYGPNYLPMFPVFLVRLFIRSVLKNIIRRSYRVIVPTPQIETVVRKYRPNVNTFMLPTGIETELFIHEESDVIAFRKKLEEMFPQLKGKRLLLFAGRVVREKNISFLLNILPTILADHPNVVLLIAGNGPDMDYFQSEVRKMELENNCVFLGYLERSDLAKIYAISEIFLFPSLTDTQGLVTLEAMFSGTPVVAIGALGTLMVMGGDNGGFMVENDAEQFTGRVLELLGDPELRSRKSAEARIHARPWSIEELTKKLVAFYKSVIQDYRNEYGEPYTPVWEFITDKRWWRINKKIFQKRTKERFWKIIGSFRD